MAQNRDGRVTRALMFSIPPSPALDVPVFHRFGPFIVDVSRREILVDDRAHSLPEKLFEVLMVLMEANGEVVDRDTFFFRIWPDENLSDANLTQHIFMLRRLLRELGGDERFILTVSGKGYRLGCRTESKIGLAMKSHCERCQRHLSADAAANICSYECTYCDACAQALHRVCKNCGGELQPRPKRAARLHAV